MGGGCGQRDQLAEGSSRFLSDLGAPSSVFVFPALEIFLEGKLGAGGHRGDLSGVKLLRRKNDRKHGRKTAVSVGNLFRNRVFCRSYHSLCRLFAGRLCRSRKASVGGSRLCGRRNGRGDDSTWQVKTRRKQNKTKENLTQTEYFLKKQTFKFEKPML